MICNDCVMDSWMEELASRESLTHVLRESVCFAIEELGEAWVAAQHLGYPAEEINRWIDYQPVGDLGMLEYPQTGAKMPG